MGAVLGMRRKNRGPVSHQVRQDKDTFLWCSKAVSADHSPRYLTPFSAIVTSPYERIILESDVEQQNMYSGFQNGEAGCMGHGKVSLLIVTDWITVILQGKNKAFLVEIINILFYIPREQL